MFRDLTNIQHFNKRKNHFERPVGAVVKDTANDAESQRFDSRAGQNGHSVANGSPPLLRSFGAEMYCPGAKSRRWAPLLEARFGVIPRV